jgi:DNA-binding protein H-NS
MPTLELIQSKIAKLQKQADALIAGKKHTVVQQILGLMLEYGLTATDIEIAGGATKTAKLKAAVDGKTVVGNGHAKGKAPAKYRNPKTGETWSGLARPPAWIKDVKDRSKFLIDGAAAPVALDVKEKRTVPPKYRDPKSGASWTGRGLAPKWIAGAKNRDQFLIEA